MDRPHGNKTWKNSSSELAKEFIEIRNETIDKVKKGEHSPCEGCCKLQESWWAKEPKIMEFATGIDYYPCNLACKYCEIPGNLRNKNKYTNEMEDAKAIDMIGFVKELQKNNQFAENCKFILSAGEATIAPNLDEFLDLIAGYRLQVNTNGIIYNQRISKLTSRKDGSYLLISIDAGTRDTYKEVKGVDAFDKLIETLRKYRDDGARIILKYIIIPENCDTKDLDGFADIVKEIKVDTVVINRDQFVPYSELGENIFKAGDYLKNKLTSQGVESVTLDFSI